jgi:hypothetical protein
LIRESLDKLITESLAIEAQEAKAAGALGYMARALTQATMPHAPSEATEFVRRNGAFTLTMFARRDVGLPYGSVPRLLMAWLTTEAVRTKEPVLTWVSRRAVVNKRCISWPLDFQLTRIIRSIEMAQ